MAELKQLDEWLETLISQLGTAQRRKLMRDVAVQLRQQQQQNIKLQRNPDGSAYEPRKAKGRAKSGRIRRQMFSKLRTARYLKTRTTNDAAEVAFEGRVQRIARVHHYGLRDRVRKYGPEVTYARRELLGITDASEEIVRDLIMEHLSR